MNQKKEPVFIPCGDSFEKMSMDFAPEENKETAEAHPDSGKKE